MKNFLRVFALIIINIVFVFTLTTFIMLSNVRGSVNTTISGIVKDELKESLSNDIQVKDFDIAEDKELDALINKYIDIFVDGIITGNIDDSNLKQDILNYLKENKDQLNEKYNLDIKDSDITDLENNGDLDELQQSFRTAVIDAKDELSGEYNWLLDFIKYIRSESFIILSVTVIVICIVLNALLMWSPYKWMLPVGIVSIISSVFTFINSLILTIIVIAVAESSSVNISINTFLLVMISLGLLILGITLLIINSNLKKKEIKEEA